jgi:imidazolonepropionase-like amidohydrolase
MIGNLLRTALFSLLVSSATTVSIAANAQTLALVGGKVYPLPDATPISEAVVLASNGIIIAVGGRSEVQIPSDARVIDCAGKTVVAGFWNSHVHFTQAVWKGAASGPAAPLTAHMQEMLTRWGFTTVWDLGSNPADTLPLRRRVNAAKCSVPTFSFSAAFFPRTVIPPICPPK